MSALSASAASANARGSKLPWRSARGGVSAERGADEYLGSRDSVRRKREEPAARTPEALVRRLGGCAQRGTTDVCHAWFARRSRGGDGDARYLARQCRPESLVWILREARISHPPTLCVPRLSAMTRTASRLGAAAITLAIIALAACAPEEIYQPAVTLTLLPIDDRSAVPSPPEDPMPAVVWPLTGLDATAANPRSSSAWLSP